MNRKTWKVALVGLGKIGMGYAEDREMAKYYRYASHAQVLVDHPRIDWQVAIEADDVTRKEVSKKWDIPILVASANKLGKMADDIDIAVIATPPSVRQEVLDGFPCLSGVLTEKPLGEDFSAAISFKTACDARKLKVQVNFWRRADQNMRYLANGGMNALVGQPMVVNCIYGNGLLNNGIHMIDLARMLFGEIKNFIILDPGCWLKNGPIPGDINPAFVLKMQTGLWINFAPINFQCYRENGIIIWGKEGRLDILNEGLVVRHYPIVNNRAMSGENEISNDTGIDLVSTVGDALYEVYDSLISALDNGNDNLLCSPIQSALLTTEWGYKIYNSAIGVESKNDR
jgi:predicted dehydrogenase